MRVSTEQQDIERQEEIARAAKAAGYYVAGVYREKASGARADRPELLRMIADLQPGEVVIGVVCRRGRNPTLRLWPAIFSGEIDVFPSERRNMGQEIGR
ncbi:recombinase family protein [Burkholderia vietnamiensis]|uniref:recombinase family protein n=1 Tax=Burkholderia vietnamiensis TaxID=60552 RepID=UPI003D15F2CD